VEEDAEKNNGRKKQWKEGKRRMGAWKDSLELYVSVEETGGLFAVSMIPSLSVATDRVA
jgi:hypothetical protein